MRSSGRVAWPLSATVTASLLVMTVMVTQIGMCSGSQHLPNSGLSFQQLSPMQAATELRTCVARYGTSSHRRSFNTTVTSGWAGFVLHNHTTQAVAGPLVPKTGSTFLRALFGDHIRPAALTTVEEYLRLRDEFIELRLETIRKAEASARAHGKLDKAKILNVSAQNVETKFWFAVVRDPLSRFVDAYVQVATTIPANEALDCKFGNAYTAK
jgi:hypothetical protein